MPLVLKRCELAFGERYCAFCRGYGYTLRGGGRYVVCDNCNGSGRHIKPRTESSSIGVFAIGWDNLRGMYTVSKPNIAKTGRVEVIPVNEVLSLLGK